MLITGVIMLFQGMIQKMIIFNFGAEKIYLSYSLDLRIAMNENFVIGIDYGKTTNAQDGDSGMYIGLNYIF